MTATSQTYRVIRLPAAIRDSIAAARAKSGRNNAAVVADAVDQQLPRLFEALKQLGFTTNVGKTKPFRLPFADDRGTLAALRDASDELGVPAVHLLLLSLTAEWGKATPKAKKASRKTKKGGL